MIKRISPITRIVLFALIAMQAFYSCNSAKDKENNAPQNGELYFKLDNEEVQEYLHMSFNDGKIEGKIFTTEDFAGEVFYSFKGDLTQDSILKVKVHYSTDDVVENWIVHFEKNKISLKNSLGRTEMFSYLAVASDQMPDATKYESVEDVRSAEEGEGHENPATICYESLYPKGNRHIVIREYIQLWNINGSITGRGAGFSEGDPEWSFDFTGSQVNDTIIEVKANYTQEGVAPFSTSETWIVDMEKGSLHLKEIIPASLRSIGTWLTFSNRLKVDFLS